MIVITQQDIDRHRPALIAWAEANGLQPDRIAQDGITIEHVNGSPVALYDEYQVDASGQKLIDPDHPDRPLRVRRSRTLLHGLPEGIGRHLCACTLVQQCSSCVAGQVRGCRSCRGTGSIQMPTSENEVARDWAGAFLRAGQPTACPHGCRSRLADTEGDQTPGG